MALLLGQSGELEFDHDEQRVVLRQGRPSSYHLGRRGIWESGWWVVRPDGQAAIGPFASQAEALAIASCHFGWPQDEEESQ